MQKQIKFLLTILTVLILSISCANINPNDPNNQNNDTSQNEESNNNNNNNQTENSGQTATVYYGNKSYTGEITQAKIEELWKESVANQTVYSTSAYTIVTGEFREDANYYETKWQEGKSPRTEFRRCIIYNYNGKDYIAGIYWDNKTGVGMQIRYRLIIIDEQGVEHAWYGGGTDASVIPDENTSDWVKYYFVFGYLKTY